MAGVLRQGFFPPGEARATSISRSGSVRSEQRSLERKGLPPFGLRPVWPVASLLVGHSPTCGGCSLLAPRHRPNWAQQNTSHLGDTTLDCRALEMILLRSAATRIIVASPIRSPEPGCKPDYSHSNHRRNQCLPLARGLRIPRIHGARPELSQGHLEMPAAG